MTSISESSFGSPYRKLSVQGVNAEEEAADISFCTENTEEWRYPRVMVLMLLEQVS